MDPLILRVSVELQQRLDVLPALQVANLPEGRVDYVAECISYNETSMYVSTESILSE